MLTCERAAAVLRGLEKDALVCEPEEIEELLALGLAIEADPEDLDVLGWLQPVLREFAGAELGDLGVIPGLEAWLKKTNEDLASDWYRLTSSKEERTQRDQDKIRVVRALALVRDAELALRLETVVALARQMVPGGPWAVCRDLGVERYALTLRGFRVRRALKVRLARYATAAFQSFLQSFDKTAKKMEAFGVEIATISSQIGYVKKNREQVVIGLAKAGVPADRAVGAYLAALTEVRAADVAVTCVRNAGAGGSPSQAAQRLLAAQHVLVRAGYPSVPVVLGAAKSLLAFDPPAAGLPRFTELMRQLERIFGRGELLYKFTTRLMPATGAPVEIAERVIATGHLLNQRPSRVARADDHRACAVALASMARDGSHLDELVKRYRDLEVGLMERGVSNPAIVEADALECMACPGSPIEVVDTVATLIEQLAQGKPPERSHIAIAAAFAKRFAY